MLFHAKRPPSLSLSLSLSLFPHPPSPFAIIGHQRFRPRTWVGLLEFSRLPVPKIDATRSGQNSVAFVDDRQWLLSVKQREREKEKKKQNGVYSVAWTASFKCRRDLSGRPRLTNHHVRTRHATSLIASFIRLFGIVSYLVSSAEIKMHVKNSGLLKEQDWSYVRYWQRTNCFKLSKVFVFVFSCLSKRKIAVLDIFHLLRYHRRHNIVYLLLLLFVCLF